MECKPCLSQIWLQRKACSRVSGLAGQGRNSESTARTQKATTGFIGSIYLFGEDYDVLPREEIQGCDVAEAHGGDLFQDLTLCHLVKRFDRDSRILAPIFHEDQAPRGLQACADLLHHF